MTVVAFCIDIGANPSAEEAEEGVEDSGKQVIDVVDGFRLNYLGDEASGSRAFNTQKEYLAQLKGTCEHSLPLPTTFPPLRPFRLAFGRKKLGEGGRVFLCTQQKTGEGSRLTAVVFGMEFRLSEESG